MSSSNPQSLAVRLSPRLRELDARAHALYLAWVEYEQERNKGRNRGQNARAAAEGRARKPKGEND